MSLSSRAAGIAFYLRGASPLHQWKSEAGTCPFCGKTVFLALAPDPFFVRCLRCRANVTNLAIARCAQLHVPDLAERNAYEMATYGSTFDFLKRSCRSLQSSEFFPGKAPGEIVAGIRNEDAQHLSFSQESLDLITSNQVFEHVPDNLQAFRECFRVLAPGGRLIFTVPLHNTPASVQIATIEAGALRWTGVPEFHSSRTTGPNSVPVFWRFSVQDIAARVEAAGFQAAEVVPITLCDIQRTPQPVILCKK